MDLSSLKEQVTNLTLYDVKAGVRKVQNGSSSPLMVDLMDLSMRFGLTGSDQCSYDELYGDGGQGRFKLAWHRSARYA
jgi:hypothetical protein